MFVKVFVLGRPGSGKTTASNYIKKRAEENGWIVNRSRDYNLLYDMFTHDVEQRRFRPTEHDGFEIVDPAVLDEVLYSLKEKIMFKVASEVEKEMLLVEFARDDYEKAFEILGAVLSCANILFVDADIDICIERIHKRILNGINPDKHFVSDFIIKGYYGRDSRAYMEKLVDDNEKVKDVQRVIRYIDNTASLRSFYARVDYFYNEMMEKVKLSEYYDHISLLQRL